MKTKVILKRPLLGGEISQDSKLGFFSATDLIRISNIKRRELGESPFNLTQWLGTKSTREFIEELQKSNERVLIRGRGRNSNTWMHPLLFIDLALSISPRLKVEVYNWIYDELIRYRNDSGSSYNKMCGALYQRYKDKSGFHKYITRVANYIRKECDVIDWNTATEEQLRLRNKMHENISLLCSVLPNTDTAVRIGIKEAKE